MTFYRNTRIEYWQSREHSALGRAFQKSRKRHTLSRGDRELPKGRFRYDLLAVNSFSRRIWGQAISNELSRFFCDGGDGTTHNRDVYFVSLMDITCARSPEDRLTDADLELIKNRLRYGLRKLSFFGMVEPAYYVNLQAGVRYDGKRCLFWHLHALVWGVSRKELKKRLAKLVKAGHYVAIADGLNAADTSKIEQGRLPTHLAYNVDLSWHIRSRHGLAATDPLVQGPRDHDAVDNRTRSWWRVSWRAPFEILADRDDRAGLGYARFRAVAC